MVVPVVAAVLGHRLPARLGLGVGARRHLHLREAVLVQVGRRRAGVDLHRAGALEAQVGLTVVALHGDRAAAVVAQLDAVVEVEDLRGQPVDGG